jgi:MFS transporter, MFS domain-containing protein family, molybdate-anion transporter
LFGIPLNLIVVGVFLSISKLGLAGAFTCSSAALACAMVSQFLLKRAIR